MLETRDLMSNYKFSSGYARWNEELKRKETWEEAVDRVMGMHRNKFRKYFHNERFSELFQLTTEKYKQKYFLASMRSLQFGGGSIEKHNAKMFNCLGTNTNRVDFFGEAMYLLLCGCGVGFSVQKHHIGQLPDLSLKVGKTYRFEIPDSIEGWADAIQLLVSSYFVSGEHKFSEYSGYDIEFDYSQIRPKGALISGGFKAPGPDGLKNSIEKIRILLDSYEPDTISPIVVYDIIMHCSDAVLSGGIRRSACIVLFSKDDNEMMTAKTGDWFIKNPQRARSNNSVVLYRDDVTREDFKEIIESIKEFGEPGFYFASNEDAVTNPCLTDDTWVSTDKGNYQIKDLIGRTDFKVLLDGEYYELSSKGFFHSGVKAVDKITFESGYDLKITPNHLVMTPNGWKEAGSLAVGDAVRVSKLFKQEIDQYDTIESIEKAYLTTDVYDVTVKDVYSFSANGLVVHNCCEIGFYPITPKGETGWAGCNLTEINGAKCKTEEEFYEACVAASFMGTLQAAYTDLKYLSSASKEIFEQEALLGVSMTGIMNNPKICLNPEIQRKGAEVVKQINAEVAEIIGIKQSARTTCVKPSGNSSVLLGSSSGIHGEHSPLYFRNVQVNKEEEEGQIIKLHNPLMVEESVYSVNKTDDVISFCIESPKDSLYKKDLFGVKQLEWVLLTQQNWVKYGTNEELCMAKDIYHNVSNTISVDNWDEVTDFIYDNRKDFTGVSLLSSFGDKDYNQAPFTSVMDGKQILKKYGNAGIFASGLIVDALKAFNNNLWDACAAALGWGEKLVYSTDDIQTEINRTPLEVCWKNLGYSKRIIKTLSEQQMKPTTEEYKSFMEDKLASSIFNYGLKKDVIRKMTKFAKKYFSSDMREMTYCLKDVYNWHKWVNIEMSYVDIDWASQDLTPQYTDIDTLGALACAGGQCEIKF